jgi:hypothetical protein
MRTLLKAQEQVKNYSISDVSESFSDKDMKEFASYLSGKKVGDLDLVLFKNER